MSTNRGIHRLLSVIEGTAHQRDISNSLNGLGIQFHSGVVVTPFPNLTITIAGISGLTTEVEEKFVLSEINGDLLIPEDLRLTTHDRVLMCPINMGSQWAVLHKVRSLDLVPTTHARFGYNGDRNSDSWAGIQIELDGGIEGSVNTVLRLQAHQIAITTLGVGNNVTIDGISFKNHTHADAQGGTTGGAQ